MGLCGGTGCCRTWYPGQGPRQDRAGWQRERRVIPACPPLPSSSQELRPWLGSITLCIEAAEGALRPPPQGPRGQEGGTTAAKRETRHHFRGHAIFLANNFSACCGQLPLSSIYCGFTCLKRHFDKWIERIFFFITFFFFFKSQQLLLAEPACSSSTASPNPPRTQPSSQAQAPPAGCMDRRAG